MQHLEGSGMRVLYTGRTVLKGKIGCDWSVETASTYIRDAAEAAADNL
jgi:hypothetical protein